MVGSCGNGRRKEESLVVQNRSFGSHQQYMALFSFQLDYLEGYSRVLTYCTLLSNDNPCRVWMDHVSMGRSIKI